MLKRNLRNSSLALLLPCLFSASHLTAQVTCTPVFPTADEAVTFTFNPQEGDRGLAAWTGDIYAHTGITTAAGDWQNVNATWGAQLPTRKMTRQANGTYTISYTSIRSAYSATASDVITAVSFVFHNGAGNNSIKGAGLGGADIFYRDIVQANSPLRTRFVTPSVSSLKIGRAHV